MNQTQYYYTTRDLLLMAALAALGGISSTYINFVGDFFQSFLGFAGTTQWASGLHVLWLVLAVGLTKKAGAGTVTGILKGAVELFSGNTHGLMILLVNLVAGILVDLGTLPFRKKESWGGFALAGGLASASNVLVFQLFAAVPADILTFGVIGLIALVAFVSGVIFAGILGSGLLAALRKSGVVKDQPAPALAKRTRWILLASGLLLAGGLFSYLKIAQPGGGTVVITGAVDTPYRFAPADTDVRERVPESSAGDVSGTYRGYSLDEVLAVANPAADADMILLLGGDGYAFFISLEELAENHAIVLQAQGSGRSQIMNVAGPRSKKAWVTGLVEVRAISSAPLVLQIQGELISAAVADWIGEMDSTTLDLGDGPAKYQGFPLQSLLENLAPEHSAGEVLANGLDGNQLSFSLQEILEDDGIRIFVNLGGGQVAYALAHLDGTVYLPQLAGIVIP